MRHMLSFFLLLTGDIASTSLEFLRDRAAEIHNRLVMIIWFVLGIIAIGVISAMTGHPAVALALVIIFPPLSLVLAIHPDPMTWITTTGLAFSELKNNKILHADVIKFIKAYWKVVIRLDAIFVLVFAILCSPWFDPSRNPKAAMIAIAGGVLMGIICLAFEWAGNWFRNIAFSYGVIMLIFGLFGIINWNIGKSEKEKAGISLNETYEKGVSKRQTRIIRSLDDKLAAGGNLDQAEVDYLCKIGTTVPSAFFKLHTPNYGCTVDELSEGQIRGIESHQPSAAKCPCPFHVERRARGIAAVAARSSSHPAKRGGTFGKIWRDLTRPIGDYGGSQPTKNDGPKFIQQFPGDPPQQVSRGEQLPSGYVPVPQPATGNIATMPHITECFTVTYPGRELWDPQHAGFKMTASLAPGHWRYRVSGQRSLRYFRDDKKEFDWFPTTPNGIVREIEPSAEQRALYYDPSARPGAFVVMLEPSLKMMSGSTGEFDTNVQTSVWTAENVIKGDSGPMVFATGNYTIVFERLGDAEFASR